MPHRGSEDEPSVPLTPPASSNPCSKPMLSVIDKWRSMVSVQAQTRGAKDGRPRMMPKPASEHLFELSHSSE